MAAAATSRRAAGQALAVIGVARAAVDGASAMWSGERQRFFFDHLAMTGEAAAAAEAAGVTMREAYSMLRRSSRFATAWRRAVDVGYDRLEAALLRRALGETGERVDVATALLLLERRRGEALPAAPARRGGSAGDARARAERELLRRLQTLAKQTTAAEGP